MTRQLSDWIAKVDFVGDKCVNLNGTTSSPHGQYTESNVTVNVAPWRCLTCMRFMCRKFLMTPHRDSLNNSGITSGKCLWPVRFCTCLSALFIFTNCSATNIYYNFSVLIHQTVNIKVNQHLSDRKLFRAQENMDLFFSLLMISELLCLLSHFLLYKCWFSI